MLFLGLGNPGHRYAETRHNVGFWLADETARLLGLRFRKPFLRPLLLTVGLDPSVRIAKPMTYMNNSGDVVPWLLNKTGCEPTSLVVLVDNMDLKPGEFRIRYSRSAGGQNGIRSILESIGPGFLRLSIGIGRPPRDESPVQWVLGRPRGDDSAAIEAAVLRAARVLSHSDPGDLPSIINAINAVGSPG